MCRIKKAPPPLALQAESLNYGIKAEPNDLAQSIPDDVFLNFGVSPLFTPSGTLYEMSGSFPFPKMPLESPDSSSDAFVFDDVPSISPAEFSTQEDARAVTSAPQQPITTLTPTSFPAQTMTPGSLSSKSSSSDSDSSASSQSLAQQPKGTKKSKRSPHISEQKRERNRLAAERYRKKGRDLVSTLEVKCKELKDENDRLKYRNTCMQADLDFLRTLVNASGISLDQFRQ